MVLRAEVDTDLCMSAGKCVADAPGAFEFDEDELSHAVDGAQSLDRARLTSIARGCPSGAIVLTEDGDPVDLD